MSLRVVTITLVCLWASDIHAQPEEDGDASVEAEADAAVSVEGAVDAVSLETDAEAEVAADTAVEAEAAVGASVGVEAGATTTPEPAPVPGPRNIGFRNGFSLSAGQESGTTAAGADISGQLYGVDWRIGTGINEAISVYLHSHLSFGTASVGGSSGATGNFATAVVGEYMLPMGLFFGAGGGYGVLNNPSGPLAQLRAGYYPFENSSVAPARRLNAALDARWYFIDDAGTGVTVTHIALSVGYDRF